MGFNRLKEMIKNDRTFWKMVIFTKAKSDLTSTLAFVLSLCDGAGALGKICKVIFIHIICK